MMYSLTTTAGLAMDVAGVTLLFFYGMPPRIKIPNLEDPYSMFSYAVDSSDQGPPPEEDVKRLNAIKRRNSRRGFWGYIMVVSAFALQAIASWMVV